MKDFSNGGYASQRYGYNSQVSYANNDSTAAKSKSVVQKKSKVAGQQSTGQNQQGDPLSRFFAMKAGTIPLPAATGMPEELKRKLEGLSGFYMGDVKVHYNSDKPAQLQAHAYAQGTDIFVAPGQEKYLPHEAWHIVQQKQGRVKPTTHISGGVAVNTDSALEKEADEMGERSLMAPAENTSVLKEKTITSGNSVIQLMEEEKKLIETETYSSKKKKRRNKAMELITKFHQVNTSPSPWEKISKNEFVMDLGTLLAQPESLNQGQVGLCGMAAPCKILLEHNPEEFVNLAISLYLKGVYKNNKVYYESNPDFWKKEPSKGLGPVGFIVMIPLYAKIVGNDFDLEKNEGFRVCFNECNETLEGLLMDNSSKEHWKTYPVKPANIDPIVATNEFIHGIQEAILLEHSVLLFVHQPTFKGEARTKENADEHHVLQITEIEELDTNVIKVQWWSWGEKQESLKMNKNQLYDATDKWGFSSHYYKGK